MDILFAVGSASVMLVMVVVVYAITPLREMIKPKMFMLGIVVVFALIVYFAVQTYGPRNSLHDRPMKVYVPEGGPVPEAEPLIRASNRIGQFDDALENEKPD